MKHLFLSAMLVGLLTTGAAVAEDHQVQMLNRGSDGPMVFVPAFLQIAPGDTVTFLPTNPSHNAETIPGMLPDGAAAFTGAMNQPVTATFDQVGVYGIRCAPHYAAGMVALIEVGDGTSVNGAAAAAVRHPGLARRRMGVLISESENN
ncbi:pseudoazurin [uncultured Maricaulis sp.]|jgi:pseudoazurin|uniref:pseudoazurin n=1 Tax=uncultured Maricaulis sp. TaxID=174710 RepID=UPI0030DC2224|tara:strand:- start:61569 stop:62012 length:444 start_codon:yes stop_codon:yes gene_type:complete